MEPHPPADVFICPVGHDTSGRYAFEVDECGVRLSDLHERNAMESNVTPRDARKSKAKLTKKFFLWIYGRYCCGKDSAKPDSGSLRVVVGH